MQKIGYEWRKGTTIVLEKAKVGNWQVTAMETTRIRVPLGQGSDFSTEQESKRVSFCVQRSLKRNGSWENQQIWFNFVQELDQLEECIQTLKQGDFSGHPMAYVIDEASDEEASRGD